MNRVTTHACHLMLITLSVTLSGMGCSPTRPTEDLSNDPPAASARERLKLPEINAPEFDRAIADAIRDADRAVQASPTSADRWGQLGTVLLAHDFFDSATICFEEAARLSPEIPNWPYLEAIALKPDRPRESIDRMRAAVALFPADDIPSRIRLADALIDERQFNEAELLLSKILTLEPSHSNARVSLAKIALLQNRPQDCLDRLNLSSSDPATRTELLLAAEAHRRLGQFDQANVANESSLTASDPITFDPHYDAVRRRRTGLKAGLKQADALYSRNQVEESVRLLRSLTSEYPDSEWAHILLGRGLIRLRQLQDAEKSLQAALRINDQSYEASFRLAVAKQLQNHPREAVDWYRKTLEIQPGAAVAHKNLGQCLFLLGESEAAEQAFVASVMAQPNYVDGHLALAEYYAKTKRSDSALRALQDARRLRPDDTRIKAAIERLESARNEAR